MAESKKYISFKAANDRYISQIKVNGTTLGNSEGGGLSVDLIPSTRVFKATVDNGVSIALGDLTITLDGTSIAEEGVEKPHKGDVLIVENALTPKIPGTPAQGTEGESDYVPAVQDVPGTNWEYSAYIYTGAGDDYSPNCWQACDGKVDADNVIITKNFQLAGEYDKVGNIQKSDETFSTKGLSVAKALEQIFTKELDNSTKTNPSFTLDGTSTVKKEVGTTYPAQTFTATWKDGSYGNKAYWGDKDLRTETGAAVGTWTITAYNGKSNQPSEGKPNGDATISGNTASITTDAFTVTATGDTTIASFNVTNDLTNIKKAATNLGNEGSVVISQTTNTAQTRKVTGIRYIFAGSNTSPNDYTTVDSSGTATVQVNTNIRSLEKKVESLTSFGIVANAKQVVIAIPSNKTLTKVTSALQGGYPITGNFTDNMTQVKVGGADSTNNSVGEYTTAYKVYVYNISSPGAADTYTVTIS